MGSSNKSSFGQELSRTSALSNLVTGTSKTRSRSLNLQLKSALLAAMTVGCNLIVCAQVPAGETNNPAQSARTAPQSPQGDPGPVDIKSLPKNLFLDQKTFFTAPLQIT